MLRSKAVSGGTKVRLIETFMSPVLYCGLSTIVLRVRDDNELQALLNTAWRVTLGLNSRRTFTTGILNNKIPLKCPVATIQSRRLALWVGLSSHYNGLTKKQLGSKYVEVFSGKRSHTKCWQRQVQDDVKESSTERLV